MEISEVIKNRQSVRAFNNEAVSCDELKELIKAASEAPSWKNSQTSRYYIISDSKIIEQISTDALPKTNQKKTKGIASLIVSTFVKGVAGFDKNTGITILASSSSE